MCIHNYLLISYRRTDFAHGLVVINPYRLFQEREARTKPEELLMPLQINTTPERDQLLLDQRFVTNKMELNKGFLFIGRIDEAIARNLVGYERGRCQRLFIPTDCMREEHLVVYAHEGEWYIQPYGSRRIGNEVEVIPNGRMLGKRATFWVTRTEEVLDNDDEDPILLTKRRSDPAIFEEGVNPEKRDLLERKEVELTFEQLTLEQLLQNDLLPDLMKTLSF